MAETRVGMVRGLGPESTIDYYRRLFEAWQRQDPSTSPPIVIDSLDVQVALRLVEDDKAALIQYLLSSLKRLAGAGVDFVAMTANTTHIVFDELAELSPVFARHDITVLTPGDQERTWVHSRYIGELLKGDFKNDTRLHFLSLIQRMRDENGIDGVILGGTELPLLLRTETIGGLPMLDTTALHVDAIVARLLASS